MTDTTSYRPTLRELIACLLWNEGKSRTASAERDRQRYADNARDLRKQIHDRGADLAVILGGRKKG